MNTDVKTKLNTKILKGLSQASFPPLPDYIEKTTDLFREISARKLDGTDKGFIWVEHPNHAYIQGALKNKVMVDWGISISKSKKPIILKGLKAPSWDFVLDIDGDIIIELNRLTATTIFEVLTRTMDWLNEVIEANEKMISDIKSDLKFFNK